MRITSRRRVRSGMAGRCYVKTVDNVLVVLSELIYIDGAKNMILLLISKNVQQNINVPYHELFRYDKALWEQN